MSVGGDSNIVISTPGSTVANLNSVLKAAGISVGAILIVIAVIKLIISLAEENSSEKVKASMMFGVGIMFVSISGVLSALGVDSITSSTGANTVAGNVLSVIGVLINYAGVGLILMGVIMNIIALSSENSDEQVKAVKMIASGIAALSAGGLCTYIKTLVVAKNTSSDAYVNGAVNWISALMTYAGAGFIVIAVFKMIMALRVEDSKERDQSIRLFLVGISLFMLKGLIKAMGYSI